MDRAYMKERGDAVNIENVQCFVSLAECLSFTHAAEKEHITQTTMSRKIQALEEELNTCLLYRDTKQVKLTMAGTEFYKNAKKILALYHETVKSVQDANANFESKLRLGIGIYDHVLLNDFLPDYVRSLNKKVKFSCQQSPYSTLADSLKERWIDIAIGSDRLQSKLLALNSPQLGSFTIDPAPWPILMHRDNLLTDYETVPLELLSGQTMISILDGSIDQLKETFSVYFPIKDALLVNSLDAKLTMVNAGLGVSFVPQFILPLEKRYQNIVMRPTNPPYRNREFKLYYWKDNSNPLVHEFVRAYQAFCCDRNKDVTSICGYKRELL